MYRSLLMMAELSTCCWQDDENENEELDEENVEGKLAWQGGRTEEATYEAGDAEDKAASAAAQAQAARQAGEFEVRICC